MKSGNKNQKIPFEDLYIYNFQGKVCEEDEQILGDAFIGNWVEDDSSFLFFSKKSYAIISKLLARNSNLTYLDDYHFTYKHWQGGDFFTIRVGNLLITSPWEDAEAKTGEIKILLDPGVVFGTGLHPTTRNCLEALLYLHGIVPFRKVLDLGTGTGILAISAAALSANEVTALDLNPLAVKTAIGNVKLNGFDGIIDVVEGRAEDAIKRSGDLIIANIHYEVISYLFDQDEFLENEWIIVSGLMRSQAFELKDKVQKRGLKVSKEWDHEMTWYTYLLKKRN